MKIVNINSSIQFPEEAINMCYSRDDFSQLIANRCPVFLVDSSLMDSVYYPWKLRSYNNGGLRKKLDSAIEKITNITNGREDHNNLNSIIFETLDSFWNQLEECRDNTKTVSEYTPAVGLFVREIDKDTLEKIQKESTTNIENYVGTDVIILCPERIEKWSNEIHFSDISSESSFSTLISSVWFHEAAHAWVQTNSKIYQSDWGYIIEESLAQAYSINSESRTAGKRIPVNMDLFIRRASGSQHFPYNSWAFWKGNIKDILSSWRDNEKGLGINSPRYHHRWNNTFESVFENIYNAIGNNHRRNETSISSEQFWKLKAMELLHWSVSK